MADEGIPSAKDEVLANQSATKEASPAKSRRWTLRIVASSAAVLFGAWIGAQLWPHWQAYREQQPPKPDAPSLTEAPAVAAPAAAPDANISAFGTDASASEKPQQLVLVGTAPGRTSGDGTATLGTDPRNPQTYSVGSVLANGAVIAEIHADRVVLTLGGRRTTLAIDRNAAARIAMRDSLEKLDHASPTVLDSLATPISPDAATTIGGPSARATDRTPSSRDDFSAVMRSQPVFERDKVAGFQIFAGAQAAALGRLGLKEGDIVRSIEGKPVDGEGAWQAIDDAVSTGVSIVVGIERDGSLQSISIDGAQLIETPSASAPAFPNS